MLGHCGIGIAGIYLLSSACLPCQEIAVLKVPQDSCWVLLHDSCYGIFTHCSLGFYAKGLALPLITCFVLILKLVQEKHIVNEQAAESLAMLHH